MNLFWLSLDPKTAAKYHVDRHAVKMVTETAQLLCSALWICGIVDLLGNPVTTEPPYRLTHKNHPCAVWVRESLENYLWTVDFLEALGEEYTFRYGRRHKSAGFLDFFRCHRPLVESKGLTVPPRAMPDMYKVGDGDTFESVIESYWWYYALGKRHLHAWKKRGCPADLSLYLLTAE